MSAYEHDRVCRTVHWSSIVYADSLAGQLNVKVRLKRLEVLDSPLNSLSVADGDFFPNIKKLFSIACTVSISSAECVNAQ